jgi:rubrerythrin
MAFSSLDEILAFAVSREVEAAAFYADLAGKARTAPLRALLNELEEEERQHKLLLEKYRAGSPVPAPGVPVPDMGLTAAAGGESFDPAASVQDALIVAARKEAAAADLYGRLAAAAADSAAREMFEFLVRQELRHKFRLESEYEARVLTED